MGRGKAQNRIPIFAATIGAAGAISAALIAALLKPGLFSPTSASKPPIVATDRLCELSHSLEYPIADDGKSSVADLLPYYEKANAAMFKHLRSEAAGPAAGRKGASLTYVAGAAGVGKSYVARVVAEATRAIPCPVSLRDRFAAADFGQEIARVDDLVTLDRRKPFNALPGLVHPERFTFVSLIRAAGCVAPEGDVAALITVDDLDEIHPDSAKAVLRGLEQFSKDREGKRFVATVVFGRPEGFAPWLRAPERLPPPNVNPLFTLRAPTYSSTAALHSLWLNVRDVMKKSRPDIITDEAGTEGETAFLNTLKQHPFLQYTVGNLALANYVVEQVVVADKGTELEIKQRLFDNILSRNNSTHGRPGPAGTKYVEVLEEIAAKYADQFDRRGYFVVGFTDTVGVEVDGGADTIRVRDALDRSGVSFLDPADFTTMRYRFEPAWVHEFLVERRNERLHSGYRFKGCEGRSMVTRWNGT